jgi:polysaccharide export outer membrane protein
MLKETQLQLIKRTITLLFALSALISSHCAFAQLETAQYALGSGDVIKITVFGQDDLTFETRLSNLGVIHFPFLGDIKLVGKTVNQIETLIDRGLRGDYLVNPSVSVTVIEYRPFFIDGEVKKPGGYAFQPGLTLDKAVALAGGFTERATKPELTVKRTINAQLTTLQLAPNDIVMPGDIVTINSRFF